MKKEKKIMEEKKKIKERFSIKEKGWFTTLEIYYLQNVINAANSLIDLENKLLEAYPTMPLIYRGHHHVSMHNNDKPRILIVET
jgi:hypothetical protein